MKTFFIALLLLLPGWLTASDHYDEAAALLRPRIPVMERYLKVAETSNNPDEIAQVMNDLADTMDAIAPKIHELSRQHPGMEAEKAIPPRYNALKKRLQSLMQRFVASYPRVLPFLSYPQVFQANQRVINHLTGVGAEW
ncbi:MAG: hypothetical protein LBH14_08805 [Desulfobulbaceae bacterium]|jgi:hypothetical protein|nr:hypothetical protein [Desulfobulbaceae bacterium]